MTPKRKGSVVKRSLLSDISSMIEEARSAVALTVNAGLTLLYWQIGTRIHEDILAHRRAEHGKQILVTLSQELMAQFGPGYSASNLSRMVTFAEAFPSREILASLLRQSSWSHFVAILPLNEPLQRDFYAEMCATAAVKWCERASEFALGHGGKPWQYVLIPHDVIAENMTLNGLAGRYTVKNSQ